MSADQRPSRPLTEQTREFRCGCSITLIYRNGNQVDSREVRCINHATKGSDRA